MPRTDVGGLSLYYEVHGEGDPMVLIPGLGADARLLAPMTRALSGSHRVLVLDPRDAGRSDAARTDYGLEDVAADTAALMAHVGMQHATVLGYSMGGRVAISLALQRPDLVGRLVLVATSARHEPARVGSRRWFLTRVAPRVPLPRAIDPQTPRAFERQRRVTFGFDASSRLGELDVPTLVVHGRRYRVVPLRLARELATKIRGARLVVVPGGHFGMLWRERPRLLDEVDRFAAP